MQSAVNKSCDPQSQTAFWEHNVVKIITYMDLEGAGLNPIFMNKKYSMYWEDEKEDGATVLIWVHNMVLEIVGVLEGARKKSIWL